MDISVDVSVKLRTVASLDSLLVIVCGVAGSLWSGCLQDPSGRCHREGTQEVRRSGGPALARPAEHLRCHVSTRTSLASYRLAALISTPLTVLFPSLAWCAICRAAHNPAYIAEDIDIFDFELTVAEMATLAKI